MAVAQQRSAPNYYETLGVPSSASADEIRRAYRILARRYHPDVNPGKASEEKFKLIADAYRVLSDASRRQDFDRELEELTKNRAHQGYRSYEQAVRRAAAQDRAKRRFQEAEAKVRAAHQARSTPSPQEQPQPSPVMESIKRWGDVGARAFRGLTRDLWSAGEAPPTTGPAARRAPRTLSVIEISLTLRDAILGARKSVELEEPSGATRKVSVRIPAGIKNGSVLRTRTRDGREELVVIARVAQHPFLRIEQKGLVAEIPVTPQEALAGANITVPTLEDPVVVKIPPGSQSGLELRLKERGIPQTDGTRGDLFYRLMIRLPPQPEAPGLKEKIAEVERYFDSPVRQGLPKSLVDAV